MSISSNEFGSSAVQDLGQLIRNGAFLVDVRTPAEFSEGHVKGSVNIPLDTIPSNLEKFQGKGDIIVFCRSGNRSGQAKLILEANGILQVVNGGTWQYVNEFVHS